MKNVLVVDYGVGNLLSVDRALAKCGARVELSADPASIERAERLVLPGVGAFADGMAGLQSRGLCEPLRRFARSGRPFLGICLGMQLMFEQSSEHGRHPGLALVPGYVTGIPGEAPDGSRRKIPHIGWAALRAAGARAWSASLLCGLEPDRSAVYFVHSFHAVPGAPEDVLAVADYAGFAVTAAFTRDNLHGCQFHPEKSGAAGLEVLRGFLALDPVQTAGTFPSTAS